MLQIPRPSDLQHLSRFEPAKVFYRPLGSLRFFLALLVMLQHYLQWCLPGPVQQIVMLVQPGSTAVFVFFFLSGFVITEAADLFYFGRPGSFVSNRLLRIVPPFAAAILVSFVALYVLSVFVDLTDEAGHLIQNPISFSNLAKNIYMLFPVPGRFSLEPDFMVLRIAWALRVEMAFYLFVAGILALQLIWRGVSFEALFNTAALCLMPFSIWYLVFMPAWNPLIAMFPYFCAGNAFYFSLKGSMLNRGLFVVAAISSGASILRFQSGDSDVAVGMLILFAALISVAAFLAARPTQYINIDRWLGDLSYPLYVGHWLPLLIFASLVHADPSIGHPVSQALTITLGLVLPLFYLATIEPLTSRIRAAVRGVPIR